METTPLIHHLHPGDYRKSIMFVNIFSFLPHDVLRLYIMSLKNILLKKTTKRCVNGEKMDANAKVFVLTAYLFN
ncbi:hypothetical protein A1OW_01995 [Enterovibrio norvegicus]|uniref:Uncharacterized protein n=1 Tax=Enterovibrio norvegicus DSM 15893 TaxID=1121869 RepID=A0A1I5RWA6_9GAMM|nr:hypothetical protein [Enterovibrio norvegicus]OEF49133.1 hypothetical protein A1OW_01995 [Enterovibrio norvegicus]SFP62818.1 hypothetical protein SAMN03084138_02679 [Enterovibrio norvegicus DSM 15893]